MATVLLIEDEELVRYSLRRVLEDGGHDVFEASDGKEGVAEFQRMAKHSSAPDVIVTDILMPKKHGYDTISEIKGMFSEAKIIAISGGGNTNSAVFLDISKLLGVKKTLSKPFSPKQLLQAVDHCLTEPA
jgi:CheY-like chemotaxis protein